MYNATPGVFEKKEAAEIVAKGYSIEESNKWIVCYKSIIIDSSKTIVYYKPVNVEDYSLAHEDGWNKISITKIENKNTISPIINPNRCDLAKKQDPVVMATDFCHIIIKFQDEKLFDYDKAENFCMDSDFNYESDPDLKIIKIKCTSKQIANNICEEMKKFNFIEAGDWENQTKTIFM